jgi:SAM-dependent methyltransferase
MHSQLVDWLTRLKRNFPESFEGRRVLDAGSMDVNGTSRPWFENCEYTGVDWRDGPCVDVVSLLHEYQPDCQFDTVISTEMLEHDPFWRQSIVRMVHLVRPGGSLIISAAGPGRTKHRRDHAPDGEYYGNVCLDRLLSHIWREVRFEFVWLEVNIEHHDVYAFFDGKLEENDGRGG